MAEVLSLHTYELVDGVDAGSLRAAFARAREEGLFDLPGLRSARLLRGIRGRREGKWAALWVYESLEAWERLWGPVGAPHGPDRYPDRWRRWEQELLAPLLDRDPDTVTLTSYRIMDHWAAGEGTPSAGS